MLCHHLRHAGPPRPAVSGAHRSAAAPRPAIRPSRRAQIAAHADDRAPSTSGRSFGADDEHLDLEVFLERVRERRAAAAAPGVAAEAAHPSPPGRVYLVGTGPGDPGLLTLRAVQLMRCADVVLYDRLVSDDCLRLVHGGARMVYVGKQAGYHTRRQEEIHELLLAFAEAGATVVRLKGGDPYVFGRGGEEVQYLRANGVQVLAVPGVTAAAGICAELGIPMTHRGAATAVRFLTGHSREGEAAEAALAEAVAAAADPHTTLVVYMGLGTLPGLVAQLAAHGMDLDTPAVAVERGTTADQRSAFATLGGLEAAAREHALRSPTLIVIGAVVALAPGWEEWHAAGRPRSLAAPLACARAALPDAVEALLGTGGGWGGGGEGEERAAAGGERLRRARQGAGAVAHAS
ncbi:MAG: tetrapyrrole methylase [Monoraphidium minutum]|nr:MAG: tetrapyrrole methylase [Monoraphidium minutum]